MEENIPQKNPSTPTPIQNGEPATIGGRPLPHLESGGSSLEGFQAANAAPDPASAVTLDKKDLIADFHKEQTIPNVRTFESDVAEAVQHSNLSVVSIAAQKIQQRNPLSGQEDESGHTKSGIAKKILMIAAAVVLIIVSVGAVGYAFFASQQKPIAPSRPILAANGLISSDDSKTVSVASGETTLSALIGAQSLLTKEQGTIVQINFTAAGTTTVMDSQTFLTDLGAKNIPTWFIRAIGPSYMAGFYHDGSNWDPFLVLSVSSYDNAFAGMLQWETGIASDLAPLYTSSTPATPIIITQTIATSTSTSTPTSIILSAPPAFNDAFIDNENVRVLAAPGQQPELLYSFPEQSVLVITTTQAAITELFNRLVNRQFVR